MFDSTTDNLATDSPLADLGPLAWVFDELRKSLDGANKAIKRFVREAAQLEPGGLDAPDPTPLRMARQQLHQAVGALEMVGLEQPAQVLRGMEAAVQRFVQRPQDCTEAAVQQVEHAGFALLEYLQALLNNKPLPPLVLFPQYRSVQKLAAVERIHPADLWSFDRLGLNIEAPAGADPKVFSDALRSMFERLVLLSIKTDSPATAVQLTRICAGLSVSAVDARARTFWHVASAFFEGVSGLRIPADVYAKRSASRVLLQFISLMPKGNAGATQATVSETLLRDLLFFCAHAKDAGDAKTTPHLVDVRRAFGLADTQWVDYSRPSLGQFDPAVLAQARKRVQSAKESWGLLTGGDVNRGRQVTDQFSLIGDSLLKLHPASEGLARVLNRAIEHAVRDSKRQIRPELAMEVATTTLYLEAALEDFDPADPEFGQRCNELAARLEGVLSGEPGRPLDGWMEQLYRRVSDRQTMGSVVGELKVSLAETEKTLDQFFRMPHEKAGLLLATSQLAQMRGVLSVLGLEQAVQTVNRMRTTVEEILDADSPPDAARDSALFQQLGTNLSALSFLVDMLNYQPVLAKKLFVFDDAVGELRPLMGRAAPVVPKAAAAGVSVEPRASPIVRDEPAAPAANDQASVAPEAVQPATDKTPLPPVVAFEPADADDDDEDLRSIFLEEAREVVVNGNEAVRQLRAQPDDLAQLTTLRRAFHTLKGSSRMVGLSAYGEAAWAMEQVFNAVLAEQSPASPDLLTLAHQSLTAFGRWADDIESKSDASWTAQPFVDSAQALRDQSQFVPLEVPGAESVQPLADWQEPEEEPLEVSVQVFEPSPDDEVLEDDWIPADFTETAPADLEALAAELEEVPEAVPEAVPASSDVLLGDLEFEAGETFEVSVDPAETSGSVAAPDVPSMFDGLSLDLDDLPDLEPSERADEPSSQDVETTDADAPLPLLAETSPEGDLDAPEHDLEVAPDDLTVTVEDHEAIILPDEDAPAELPAEPAALDLSIEEVPSEEVSGEEVSGEEAPTEDGLPDEQTRQIGPLRIDLKLYNVYLNEADEWSRRLVTSLSEWLLECHEPLPAQAESLAHSLAGSSATVGFQPLSEISRALEHALGAVGLHQREGRPATQAQAQLFADASEDIRRLLHQFAAGFFKEPAPDLLESLSQLVHELPPSGGSSSLDIELSSRWESELPEVQDLPETAVDLVPDEVPSAFAPPDFEDSATAEVQTLMAPLPLPTDARSSGTAQDIDDDIDALDSIDVDLFPIFADEAQELLPQMGSALRQWVARPDNGSARGEVLRNLHTLKGSARLAGALRLGEMAHRMETVAERLDLEVASSQTVSPLLVDFDALVARFELLRNMDPESHAVVQIAPERALDASEPVAVALEADDADQPADTPVDDPETEKPVAPEALVETGVSGLSLPPVPKLANTRAGAAVRVRPELLDRLVNQTGEVITTRSRMDAEVITLRTSLKELTGNLERLRQQLHDMEIQAETQMQARLAQARDADQTFDPLELDRFTRVQEITRMMAESVNDVATVQRNLQRAVEVTEDGLAAMGRQTRELQRDLLRTRMVEFEGISERLYRVVRQASKETGKQVRLDISGGHIEMDRGVLDRMTAAFEHILRNCVVHGVEDPDVRLAAGKSAEGRIQISLAQELNDVSVVFQDDGAGLNLNRLREKATAMGILAAGQTVNDAEAADLVFEPGLSTATEVSSLAGRGVGMDVVRNDVVALGGRVETSSREKQGTAFKLVLPLTTAVTQVVMLRAGSLTVGVPSSVVELVRRVTAAELAEAYEKGTLAVGDEKVPFYWSGALLQASPASTQMPGRTLPVVVFRSAAQRVAMHVDEVLGNQEVVVKNLGSQLSRLPGLAGMSVLASGAVALIYNPVALAKVYGAQVREWLETQRALAKGSAVGVDTEKALPTIPNAVPLVLVVDDSITVRRVTQRLLQREGYRVSLAADGLQALERLQQERPAVVLSDIEMPRMDGFDLVRNLRNDPRLTDLPVIMITSRIAEKHREHARELGVDHYLGKPYSEDELLGLIARYTQTAAAQV